LSSRPCLPCRWRRCRPVGLLRSTGITPLPRYYEPVRHPLAFRPLPRDTGYRAYLAPPLSRRDEEGFSSCSARPGHRAVAPTPPECPAASATLRRVMRPSPSACGLGLQGWTFRGLLGVHSRYGPVTHSPSSRWSGRVLARAQEVEGFQPRSFDCEVGSHFHHSHVSSALPKIPDSGFSPVRLQAEARFRQPGPSRRTTEVKHQVCIPSLARRFDVVFVACDPLADSAGVISQPASGSYSNHPGPRVLCSEKVMLSLSSTLCDPIRQSRQHSLTSQGSLGYTGSRRPTTWSGLPPRLSLLWVSAPSTRAATSTPGGEAGPYPR
jgi:hypothetical protein